MMVKKIIALISISTIIMMMCVPFVYASSGITLTVSNVTANQGEDIEVPIVLSDNSVGVAGMTISVSYDNNLTLKSITRGNALSSLNYTPPGNIGANPFNMVFYGLDGDKTNGTVATLTFTSPTDVTGKMNVNVSYTVGNIYDGDLNDLDVNIINGSVEVVSSGITEPEVTEPTLEVSECTKGTNTISFDVYAKSPDELSGKIIVATYKDNNSTVKVKMYPVASEVNVSVDTANAEYIKVFWWDNEYKPIAEYIKIDI